MHPLQTHQRNQNYNFAVNGPLIHDIQNSSVSQNSSLELFDFFFSDRD